MADMELLRPFLGPFSDLHLHNGTLEVYVVVILAAANFLAGGIVLIYGAHKRWYEGRELTWRRWLFPAFLVRLGRPSAMVYGYFFGVWFLCVGLSMLRALTR
jgi:hypothetical protein